MEKTVDPARDSLRLALGAVSLIPLTASLFFGEWFLVDALGLPMPESLSAVTLTVAILAVASSVICTPIALAALMSYRRQTSPSPRRTAWTALVLSLLLPLVLGAGGLAWSLAFSR